MVVMHANIICLEHAIKTILKHIKLPRSCIRLELGHNSLLRFDLILNNESAIHLDGLIVSIVLIDLATDCSNDFHLILDLIFDKGFNNELD